MKRLLTTTIVVLGILLSSSLHSQNNNFYFDLGLKYMLIENDYYKAIDAFDSAIKEKPDSPGTYYYRGLCKYYLEYFSEAIQDITIAIESHKSPDGIFQWYYDRGKCYQHKYEYDNAISDFSKSLALLELDKDISNKAEYKIKIYNSRGFAKLWKGLDSKEAAIYFGEISSKEEKLDYIDKKIIASIPDFNKSIELNAINPTAYSGRAYAKLYTGNKEGACFDMNIAANQGNNKAYEFIVENCN